MLDCCKKCLSQASSEKGWSEMCMIPSCECHKKPKCRYGHAWRVRGWQEEKNNKDNLIKVVMQCEECNLQITVAQQ